MLLADTPLPDGLRQCGNGVGCSFLKTLAVDRKCIVQSRLLDVIMSRDCCRRSCVTSELSIVEPGLLNLFCPLFFIRIPRKYWCPDLKILKNPHK